MMLADFDKGGVKVGELDPKSAVTCRPSAAATCINPESFVTTWRDPARMCIACLIVVLPTRFTTDA
jgi:hypothetical protein